MAPISSAKLTYFDGRGRGEICRWTLAHAGVEFEDYRVKDGEWSAIKLTSPTLMVPFAEFDGKVLASSQAISAYVAKQYDFGGANDFEEAEMRMCMDMVTDTMAPLAKLMFTTDEEEKKTLNQKYCNITLLRLLEFVERRLDGHNGWLVGGKVSVADIALAQFLYDHQDQEQKDVIKSKEAAYGHMERLVAQKNIQQWIEKRPENKW